MSAPTALDTLAVPLYGTHLIEASAGTGKTHAITVLYVRCLLEFAAEPKDVLVVTYTNAATAELRERIRAAVQRAYAALRAGTTTDDEGLDRVLEARRTAGTAQADATRLLGALHGFDEAAIFTIHGFCQRVLQDHAFESGVPFDAELVTDESPLLGDVVCDFWVRELHDAPIEVVRYLGDHGVTIDGLEGLAALAIRHPDMRVLPERPTLTAADIETAIAGWRCVHERVAALWRRDREPVVELLCDATALKGNIYKAESIRSTWVPALDGELTSGRPGIDGRVTFFHRLTPEGLATGCKKNQVPPEHPFFEACGSLRDADAALDACLEARTIQLRLDTVAFARHELRRRKEARRLLSFDDLLQRVAEALRGAGGDDLAALVRRRYRAALIDEFQDTDPVQYEIFQRVYRGAEAVLFLIGDPKQAIYAFRGADVFAYIASKRDAGSNLHTLRTNWRSDPTLVKAVNQLFRHARRPFVFDEIPFHPASARADVTDRLGGGAAGWAPFEILFVPRRGQESEKGVISKAWGNREVPRYVAAQIVRTLNAGATIGDTPVRPCDIAVLCRTNDQARAMQRALRACRVPSVLQSEASVFDSAEAEEVARLVRALADPADGRALGTALATPMLGYDAAAIDALREDERQWDEWLTRVQDWHVLWERRGFAAAFRAVIETQQVPARLLAFVDGERRLTNVLHLAELLHTASAQGRLGPLALVEWLAAMRRGGAARAALQGDAAQLRLESDADAVQLVTVHRSKGLQYPIVYCPFVWDGFLQHEDDQERPRFHDRTAADRLTLDVGSGEFDVHGALARREAFAEHLRLLYVAVTRAKHRCSVVWGAVGDATRATGAAANRSALGYLLYQAPEVPGGDPVEDTATRLAELMRDDEALYGPLEALAHASAGAIAVADLPIGPADPYVPAAGVGGELRCPTPMRDLDRTWRASSFSALVARTGALSQTAAEGVDYDAEVVREAAVPAPVAPTGVPVVLHDFPSGTRPGTLVHRVFEQIDFGDEDRARLQTVVGQLVAQHGLDVRWAAPLSRAVGDVLDTPLAEATAPVRLRDVPRAARLTELEFLFPVCEAVPARGGVPRATPLTAARLAALFAAHARPPVPADYPERLARLQFAALAGYLRGFVDLVFEHDGRWYVVDYKSNHMGAHAEDYAPPRLAVAMAEHHYVLQYHLYLVALHRYLQVRLPDYDYERHVAGAYYLFVRGMGPDHPRGSGVFHDRPSRAFIDALSAMFGGSEAR